MLDQDIIADGKRLQCVSSAVSSVVEVFFSQLFIEPCPFFDGLGAWLSGVYHARKPNVFEEGHRGCNFEEP